MINNQNNLINICGKAYERNEKSETIIHCHYTTASTHSQKFSEESIATQFSSGT
jgi:hypothetical protein